MENTNTTKHYCLFYNVIIHFNDLTNHPTNRPKPARLLPMLVYKCIYLEAQQNKSNNKKKGRNKKRYM